VHAQLKLSSDDDFVRDWRAQVNKENDSHARESRAEQVRQQEKLGS
jgi:hypothetical protein